MTPQRFNRLLRQGARASESELQALERAYASTLRVLATMAASRFEEHATAIVAAGEPPTFGPPDPDEILPRGAIEKEMAKRTRAARARAMRKAAEPALRAAGIAFDVGGVFSDKLVKMAGARAVNLGVSARDVIRVVIADALNGGFTVPETASAIRAGIRGATPALATMLARTDLVGTQNGASVTAARQVYPGGDLVKTWLATEDERTRPSHVDADGQSVPLDASFQVGEDLLDYPGDPDGSDEEVCNCRCTVIYEPVPEAVAASGGRPQPYPDVVTSGAPDTMGGEMSMTVVATREDWRSVLAVEGMRTEDGRYLEPGSIRWRELPLTLSAQTETAEGHDGAEVAGRIDAIQRVGNEIRATGVFDSGDYGQEIGRMVRDRVLRGVSVDLAILDFEYRDADGNPIPDDQLLDAIISGDEITFAVLDAVIGMATITPFQAIEPATIEVVASAAPVLTMRVTVPIEEFDELDGLTAAAVGVPDRPPRSRFDDPEFAGPTPWTVQDDGYCFGHVALWESCHVGEPRGPGVCVKPTISPSDYAHFHLGEIVCDDGSRVAVGTIALDGGHAPLGIDPRDVVRHYDNTTTAAADVRAGEDSFGIWVVGSVRPDLPARKMRALRAAKLSGDWRRVSGMLDLVAVLCVNTPGYPVPRALVASVGATEEVIAVVSAGMVGYLDEIQAIADTVVREEIDRVAAAAV